MRSVKDKDGKTALSYARAQDNGIYAMMEVRWTEFHGYPEVNGQGVMMHSQGPCAAYKGYGQ
jgi:hypothetical protein